MKLLKGEVVLGTAQCRKRLVWLMLAMMLSPGSRIGAASAGQQEANAPPVKLIAAELPVTPRLAASGGEVLLEVQVGGDGTIDEIMVLTDTPPFTDEVVRAVREWRFRPAVSNGEAHPSHVLVAAYYRDPAFYSGTTAGEPPRVVQRGSRAIPYPERVVIPPFPPMAYDEGTALLSVHISPAGNVEEAEVVSATPGFEDAVRDAVEGWHFESAAPTGERNPSIAYVIVGFRQPVVR